jgi:membrane protease YdiL (CAAX protease family)
MKKIIANFQSKTFSRDDIKKYTSLILSIITTVVLIPLKFKTIGWTLLLITIVFILFCEKKFKRDMLLIIISLALLGSTTISTELSLSHIIQMCSVLCLTVIIPYTITRYWYKDKTIKFSFRHGKKWLKSEILYIFITIIGAYFFLPFYFRSTGSYVNWTVEPSINKLCRLFFGTNVVGSWDELFFVSTVFALFKKHFSFKIANGAQAVFFTAFLYELGFRGWAPFFLYPFALSQGYIFKKTNSLIYVITIHLSIDLVLYLALINAHHPGWLRIFIT